MDLLADRRGAWLRQFSDMLEARTAASPAARIAAIAATLNANSIDLLQMKLLDGLDWVGGWDSLTPVTDVASALALRDGFAAFGISVAPVVNPRGLAGEGELHGALAAAFGCIVVDIEDGTGFWDQSPATLIPVYFRALRAAAGQAVQIVAQPDPRNVGDVYLTLCLPYISGIAAQHYVGWASIGWTDVAAEVRSYQALAALGKPCYPTVWGEETIGLAAQFWTDVLALKSNPPLGVCAFALGAMDADHLAAYAWFGLPTVPAPPKPLPTPSDADYLTLAADAAGRNLAQLEADIKPFEVAA